MEQQKINNIVSSSMKLFVVSWISMMAILPYLLSSFALMNINFELGSGIFDYFFIFFGPPSILVIILFVLRRQVPVVGGLNEFIATHAKKVFYYSVILFYLLIIISVFINIVNIIFGLIMIVFSLVFFPVTFFMLKIGQKNLDRIKNSNI